MKKNLFYKWLSVFTLASMPWAIYAQCPQLPTTTITAQPTDCTNALNIVPYFNVCQTICMNNTNAGNNNVPVIDLSCFGGTANNDLYLTAPNPYNTIPNYDGSLAFRWVDWPGRGTGVNAPTMAMHAEVAGSIVGLPVNLTIDCKSAAPTQSNNFVYENAMCIANPAGRQFYAPAGTLPRPPFTITSGGQTVNVNNIQYYLQVVTSNGATGNMCFEVSPYEQGWLCGDAKTLTLSGGAAQVTGSSSACLCQTALDGTLFHNVTNNLPVPCGVESPASAWYVVQAPFACNKITANLSAWGGSDQYNVVIMSAVNCPGTSSSNPVTGAPVTVAGQTLNPGSVLHASACGQAAITSNASVPAGTYFIYVSGKSERPTFTLNVTVDNVSPSAGTASSSSGANICSAGTVQATATGSTLPFSANGQTILWYASTSNVFNPYNGQGTLVGTGANASLTMPANNTCAAVPYYVKGIVSDNGTTPSAVCQAQTNTITVNVYPAIGSPSVLNNPCIIQVAARCPSFTVTPPNGTPQQGQASYLATFADNGTTKTFIISNGLAACNSTVTETVTCSGNCTQPTATAVTACDATDPYNFYIDINFGMGSASSYIIEASDGTSYPVTSAGNYRVGPFRNGNSISLNVTNTEDANCNLPLGSYTRNCNPNLCPNLSSATATLSGNVCENQTVVLQATVDRGVINQDYRIQWYKNGQAISGATTLTILHTLTTAQGCSEEVQTFSAQITCLNNGAPSTTPSMTAATLTVFPIPDFGTDFYPDPANCVVAPVNVCGNLIITYSPVTNPNPGAGSTTVNYTVSVPGAPSGCAATGSYIIQCPTTCSQAAGNAAASTDKFICYGESFNLSTTGTAVSNGFVRGYAVTTSNPYNNLETAVRDAVSLGNVTSAPAANGVLTFTNGNQYQPGTYWFIPFTSLSIDKNAAANKYSVTGSINFPFGGGSRTATITIPTLPYCAGRTAYKMTFTANRTSGIGNPIDGVTGLGAINYSGGSTNTLSLTDNNYTASNPSGATIQLTGSSSFGADVSYTFSIEFVQSYNYPTICNSCFDYGAPVHYELLPDIQFAPPTIPTVCVGSSIDLNTVTPTANTPGTYVWYTGNPTSGGQPLASTIVTPASGGSTYHAVFASSKDPSCTKNTSITITPTALPTVGTITPPAPICAGDIVNLTSFNNTVSNGQAGTVDWYRGDPASPNAVRLTNTTASQVRPANGTTYYGLFTSGISGCSNKTSVTYTVRPLPVLTAPTVNPAVCQGDTYNLANLQNNITTEPGSWAWYNGDPANGGTLLTTTNASPTTAASVFCAEFTSNSTGCKNKICIDFTVNPKPVLASLPIQGPICAGTQVDLFDLQDDLNNSAGTYQWYLGNPTSGGTLLSSTVVIPAQGDMYYARFTATLTGCTNTSNPISFTVHPLPTFNTINPAPICAGESVNLTNYNTQLINQLGIFEWYNGNPASGGTLLTNTTVSPTTNTTYFVKFTSIQNCSALTSITITVHPKPSLNTVTPTALCSGGSIDLATLQPQLSSETGTFAWYRNGVNITNLNITPNNSEIITTIFTNTNSCRDTASMTFTVYSPVTGITANYDCATNKLVVNFAGATGGSGSGYRVASNSPNQNNQTLANGASWTVIVEDGTGCAQATTLTGTVACIVCNAGVAVAPTNTNICCSDTSKTIIATNGVAMTPGHIIGWALSPANAAAPADSNAVKNATKIYPSVQANGGLAFDPDCSIPAGEYWLTPFIAKSFTPAPPVVYDPQNGCKPLADICIDLPTDTTWSIDRLILYFPNGDTMNVNDQFAFGLPISRGLLDLFLPPGTPLCFPMDTLYKGDPNGTWRISIHNVGSQPMTFGIDDFTITVSAATCGQIAQDQVTQITGVSTTVGTNQTVIASFLVPTPPAGFPSFDPTCEDYGTPTKIRILSANDPLCAISTVGTNSVFSTLNVYPNPTNGDITVDLSLAEYKDLSISLTDVLGREVFYEAQGSKQGKFIQSVSMDELPAGVYFLVIRAGEQKELRKIIKE